MPAQSLPEPLTVFRIEAENFRRLKVVEIEPGADPLVKLVGPNGAGKTSVIDAIAFALCGTRLNLPSPIRDGRKTARVKLELASGGVVEIVVERSVSQGGARQSLKVTDAKSGARLSSPQALIDSMIAKATVDPLAFLRLSRRELAAELARLVGLDFAKHDAHREALVEKRRALKAQREEAAAALAAIERLVGPEVDAPAESEIEWLEEKSREASAAFAGAAQAASERARTEGDLRRLVSEVAEIREERRLLEERLAKLRKREDDAREQHKRLKVIYAGSAPVDVAALRSAEIMAGADLYGAHEAAAKAKARTDRLASAFTQRERVEHIGASLQAIEADIASADDGRRLALARAAFPVKGLGFDADGYVTLDGHPFEGASHAEQLRAAVAMGFAANPRLKLLLVRDGSLLDERSMRLLAEIAAEHGGQVVVEVVAREGECGFLIEDGELVLDADETGEWTTKRLPAEEEIVDGEIVDAPTDVDAWIASGAWIPGEAAGDADPTLTDLGGDEDFDLDSLARKEIVSRSVAPGLDLPEMD